MILYEMLTGLPPWYTKDRQKLFQRLRYAPLRIPPTMSIEVMLQYTQEERGVLF